MGIPRKYPLMSKSSKSFRQLSNQLLAEIIKLHYNPEIEFNINLKN